MLASNAELWMGNKNLQVQKTQQITFKQNKPVDAHQGVS